MSSTEAGSRIPNTHIAYGRIQEVFEALALPSESGRRPLVFYMGGGIGVVTQKGIAERLAAKGLLDRAIVMGASGGSLTAVYSATKNFKAGGVFRYLCENKLASPRYLRQGNVVDWQVYDDALDQFPIDEETLRQRMHPVVVIAEGEEDGQLRPYDLRQVKSPRDAVRASCRIPGVGEDDAVEFEGMRLGDGAMWGIPIELIESYDPTDVLIIASYPIEVTEWQEATASFLSRIGKRMKRPLRRDLLSTAHNINTSVKRVLNRHWDDDNSINWAILAPARTDVSTLTMAYDKVAQAGDDSAFSAQVILERFGSQQNVTAGIDDLLSA